MKNRILPIGLVVIMLLTLFPFSALAAPSNLKAVYDAGEITVTGSGFEADAMYLFAVFNETTNKAVQTLASATSNSELEIYAIIPTGALSSSYSYKVNISDRAGNAVTSVSVEFPYTPPEDTYVNLANVAANGSSTTYTTNMLTITLSESVDLSSGNLTITDTDNTGALKGDFSKTAANTYTLAVSGIKKSGNVTVQLTGVLPDGYVIGNSSSMNVSVSCYEKPIEESDTEVELLSVTANGTAKTVTTTQLTLTFDKAITGLTADNISVVDTGSTGLKKGTLIGSGTTYTLPVTGITKAGIITVTVSNPTGYSITDGRTTTTVDVYLKEDSDPVYYTVTVTAGTGGTAGIVNPTSNQYQAGEPVYIQANAYSNYTFNSWSTSTTGVSVSFASAISRYTSFIMPDRNVTVAASFSYTPGTVADSTTTDSTTSGGTGSSGTATSFSGSSSIISQLAAGKNPVVIQMGNFTHCDISAEAIAALLKANKSIVFVKGIVSLTITPESIISGGLDKGNTVRISMAALTGNAAKVVSADDKNVELLAGTPFSITIKVDGKEVTSFEKPLLLTYNLKGFTINADQKAKTTGARFIGNNKYNQLGGNWKDNDFSFYTSKLSNYGILLSDSLVEIITSVNNQTFTVNGTAKSSDVAPVIVDSRTMIPIRFIAETLGAEVYWNGSSQTVTIYLGTQELNMRIGQTGEGLDVAPYITNDRTMVPLRYISEQLGGNVLWDDASKTITIYR